MAFFLFYFYQILVVVVAATAKKKKKNSLMARKKYLWLVDFLKSPENVVCIVIKMSDVAKS